jgi:hypothetical protein
MRLRPFLGAFAAMCLLAATADAQTAVRSWGVIFGVSPNWKTPDNALKAIFDADSISLKGSEIRIGFVRGATLEGDWGISFIQKTLSDDSGLSTKRRTYDFNADDPDEQRFQSQDGRAVAFTFRSRDTTLRGVEAHKFAVFGTIRERVQIGMNLAIGIGQLRGTVDQSALFFAGTNGNPGSPVASFGAAPVDAKKLFAPFGHQIDWVPLGKVELAVAGIILPGLKVRASGGFNMPGTQKFSINAIYMFGAE